MYLRRGRIMMVVEKVNLQQLFLSALERINPVRKYLMKFDVDDNTTASLSGNENEAYRVQQKTKAQEPPLMDMWKM
jgi:hypothetical protein